MGATVDNMSTVVDIANMPENSMERSSSWQHQESHRRHVAVHIFLQTTQGWATNRSIITEGSSAPDWAGKGVKKSEKETPETSIFHLS